MNTTPTAMANVDPDEARKLAIRAIADRRRSELEARGEPLPSAIQLWKWACKRHKELEGHTPHP